MRPLHAHRYGRGERAFVGLHGWGGSHATFAPLAARLPEDARLYAPDLPGYGRSPVPPGWEPDSGDAEGLTAPLVGWLQGLPAPRLTLVGNCSGAVLALLATLEVPGRVERLVLVDPFAYVPWYFRIFLAGAFGRRAYATTFANPLGRWITNGALRRRRSGETHLTESFAAVDHGVTLGYLRALAAAGSVQRFSGLTQAVDLAYGERSFGAVKRSVARWRAALPHARVWELAGAGHLPLVEATDRLAEIIFSRGREGGEAP